MPFTCTGGCEPNGYSDAPFELTVVPRRKTVPLAQRKPSPKTAPTPLFCCVVPWKYSAELLGIPDPRKTTVSAPMLAVPVADSAPPTPSELRQPEKDPLTLSLPQGHGVVGP